MMIEMIIDMISIMIIDRCTNSIYITYTSPPSAQKLLSQLSQLSQPVYVGLNFLYTKRCRFLLLLMVAIAPSLGKNIFLGSAQILLGYVGK